MKKHAIEFLKRGMAFGGFGPIIAGIIYVCIDASLENFSLNGVEVCLGIISTYLLAFLQAGASVFNQIEEWSVGKSLFWHFLTIYIAYTGCYLLNSWIPFEPMVIVIFTAVFTAAYFVIWLSVYFSVKAVSRRMNKKLN